MRHLTITNTGPLPSVELQLDPNAGVLTIRQETGEVHLYVDMLETIRGFCDGTEAPPRESLDMNVVQEYVASHAQWIEYYGIVDEWNRGALYYRNGTPFMVVNKIGMILAIRERFEIGLKAAKDAVEVALKVIHEGDESIRHHKCFRIGACNDDLYSLHELVTDFGMQKYEKTLILLQPGEEVYLNSKIIRRVHKEKSE